MSNVQAEALPPSGFFHSCRIFIERILQALRLVPARYEWELAVAALIMTATSAGNTVVALQLGRLIDRIQTGLQEQAPRAAMYASVTQVLAVIAAIYVTREALNVLRRYLIEDSCTSVNRHMQNKVVEHILKTNLNVLAREKVGALHGKIFRSVDGLVRFLRLLCLDCLPAFFTGLFALSAAVYKHHWLGVVMMGVIPVSVLITLRQLASQKGIRLELMRDCEAIDGTVVEQLSGTEYIRVANTLPLEMARLSSATENRRQKEMRHHFQMSLFGCAKALNEGLFHILVLALATYLAINQQITFGDILTFSVLFLSVMTPLNEIHRVIDEGQESSLRVAELLELLKLPIDQSFDVSHPAPMSLQLGQPIIETSNLVLDYTTPEGGSKRSLDGITLRIDHGQTIGVAGPSGSGKSTLIKALLRLIHPSSGGFRLGNADLEKISRQQLAELVSYVGQAPFVFSGSIRENIAYGNGDIPEERIREAADRAYLQHEIDHMPQGFDTQVLERGQNVSGGQRQRLAIARILIKNAPILILDEATSALDNISERYVQDALGVHRGTRTTIIIAHRLSTLKDCDQILVFDEGKVVEVGPYDELIARNGLFASLVASGKHDHASESVSKTS